jgi:flavin-dependent dehydrogenase
VATIADVLVVGAGPAGTIAALNLAPRRRVLLVERDLAVGARIGEALAPAARRLLADMGLLDSFAAQGHAPCHANRSIWGADAPRETDFLRDPDGSGWHLDRARFDGWLRAVAIARGAELIAPARVEVIERAGGKWRVRLAADAGAVEILADIVIDAGGRAAPIARRLGARRLALDRLVCGWVGGAADAIELGVSHVEAVADGWWYSAPLPGGRRVLAFHTDADLPAARVARDRDALVAAARHAAHLARLLSACGFRPDGIGAYMAAHSAALVPCAGECWLAAGDAALAFDPLSAQGLLNALFTGLAAAEAADRRLAGDQDALADYAATIAGIGGRYRRHLELWYEAERRWPDAPFWQRRGSRGRTSTPPP